MTEQDRDFRRADAMLQNLIPHETILGKASTEIARRLKLSQCPHCLHHYEILKSEVRCYAITGATIFCSCPCPNGRWME